MERETLYALMIGIFLVMIAIVMMYREGFESTQNVNGNDEKPNNEEKEKKTPAPTQKRGG
jgi:hypothetical protein